MPDVDRTGASAQTSLARWLPILKTCLRSFALAGALDNPLDEAVGDRRDKVTQLFEIWRCPVSPEMAAT